MSLLSFSCAVAEAATSSIVEKFRRPGRAPLALHVGGAVNDPVPAIFGIQAAVSFFDWVRVQAGVGRSGGLASEAAATTWGLGFRARLPEFTFSPVVGISWASVLEENAPAYRHVYLAAGFEWRPWRDLEVGAGYTRSFDTRIGARPYFTAHWNVPL